MSDIIPYTSSVPALPTTLTFLLPDGSELTLKVEHITDPLDVELVRSWLRSKQSAETKTAYAHDIDQFYAFLAEEQGIDSIRDITQGDIYDYADVLIRLGKKVSTQARKLATIKSLLTYATKAEPDTFPRNVGVLMQLPKPPDELAQRILDEGLIHQMIAEEKDKRNHAILSVLYYCGLRAHELCNLQWRHAIARKNDHQFGGILNVQGKGGSTRNIPVKHVVWDELQSLRPEISKQTDFIFLSGSNRNKGERITTESIRWIVQDAAKRIGIKATVSPHWMRHGHATYAQAHGASPVLVKETLGHKSLQTTTRYSHIVNGDGSGRYL